MTIELLNQYINNNQTPDISKRFALKALVDKHPYFRAGVFIYLKCLYIADDNLFRSELQRLFVSIADKRALFYYILKDEYQKFFSRKDKLKEISKSRTDILLNAFFETMDDTSIDKQIENSIMKPSIASSDYFSFVKNAGENLNETEASETKPMKHQNIIDDFINNTDQSIKFSLDTQSDFNNIKIKEKTDNELQEELQEDLFFTETLANIYIKQQKYERAQEIIKRLSLNYPEKNIYFANQISFLEKLIINKKHKNKQCITL